MGHRRAAAGALLLGAMAAAVRAVEAVDVAGAAPPLAPIPAAAAVPAAPAVPAVPAATCTITAALRYGATAADVVCVEARLLELGYALVGPDETFGASTGVALRSFQRAYGLAADGVVDPHTRATLGLDAPHPVPPPVADPVRPRTTSREIGRSLRGRSIVAHRSGMPGGRVVLVVGAIHGDEIKGMEVTRLLRTMPVPRGIDLWVVDSMNPDGVAAGIRGNAVEVDLNRNFEHAWSYIPRSTEHRQHSGEAPADQPESAAMQAFIRAIRPEVVVWYHQDLDTLTINGARPVIPQTYATFTGMAPRDVRCSQRCTGTASSFANAAVPGATSFIVELPPSAEVDRAMVRRHANALLAAVVV